MALWTCGPYGFTSLSILLYFCFLVSQKLRRYLAIRALTRKHGCQNPPSLTQWDPFFGLDLLLTQYFAGPKIRSRNRFLQSLFTSHSHTFKTHLYGSTQLFTICPSNIKAIYSSDFESWGVGPVRGFVFGPLLGPGMMTEDGPVWKHSRAITAPMFARPQFANLQAFDVHVQRLLHHLPEDDETVDMQPLFNRLALDSTTEMLFGKSVESLAPHPPAEGQTFLDAFNYAQKGVGRRMVMPFWNVFTQDKEFWKSCKTCHEFVDHIVDQAMEDCRSDKRSASQDEKYILVHELAKRTSDRIDIRRQLLNVFLPAHDAIAIPLTNIFFQLARHPAVYSKLREEILTLPYSDATSIRALKRLPYLHMIINETFRLYPGVTTNERIALNDTVLPTGGGSSGSSPVTVTKGSMVTLSFYALQRSKGIWGADAEDWKPERWTDEAAKEAAPWTNLPFGGGPRVCPGQEQGLVQLAFTIVRIVRKVRVLSRRDPVMEFEDLYRVVTVSRNGCRVALETA